MSAAVCVCVGGWECARRVGVGVERLMLHVLYAAYVSIVIVLVCVCV